MHANDPVTEIPSFFQQSEVSCSCGYAVTLIRDEIVSCGFCGRRYRMIPHEQARAPDSPESA
jgi:hypothetical protein